MTTATDREQHSFQAEVQQLLDIVIHSLYTDKDIFLRELLSNASDALEKMRLKSMTEASVYQPEQELEIKISLDEEAKTITLSDSGVGMTREELVENIGTIAHSGTKAFLQGLKEKGENNESVIGQFGVGFYSAFMVASKVEVFTRSWESEGESLKWESEGAGSYSIENVDEEERGCRIVIHLKEEHEEFAKDFKVQGLIKQYSNFISFPIIVGDERINTLDAVWRKSKSEVSEEEHKDFYQFVSHASDEPRYTMHFSADAPIAINSLLYVPGENREKFGFGQQESNVSLYCRRVLIDSKPEGLLPEWLRFLSGVIDSEDIPLNISRETMQDSSLVKKLNQLITKRFLKFLDKEAKSDPEKYADFYNQFSRFLKEGIAASYEHVEQLGSLLRFDSSMCEEGKLTSFAEYIDRAPEDQEEVYFLTGPTRSAIENGPYLEAFKAKGIEVIFFTDPVDEYVLDSLREFKGKKLISASQADIDLGDVEAEGDALPEEESEKCITWLQEKLSQRVGSVSMSKRLVGSPAAALTPKDAPSPQVRQMMQAMGQEVPEFKANLELNPRHILVKKIVDLQQSDEELAGLVAEQLADNALLAAGMLEEPRSMVNRLNTLLEKALK